MLMLQEAFCASGLVAKQSLLLANSPVVTATLLTLRGLNPPLVRMTVCVTLVATVVGMGWLPNTRLLCDRLTPAVPATTVTVAGLGTELRLHGVVPVVLLHSLMKKVSPPEGKKLLGLPKVRVRLLLSLEAVASTVTLVGGFGVHNAMLVCRGGVPHAAMPKGGGLVPLKSKP
jgi:hypothetical protein